MARPQRPLIALAAAAAVGLAACGDGEVTSQATPSPTAATPSPTASPTPTSTDDGTAGETGDGAGDESPSPTASPSPPATARQREDVRFTPEGSVFSPVGEGAIDNPHRTDSCPIRPHAEQNFTACEVTRSAGGEFAVTTEEFAGDRAATIFKRVGDQWEQVESMTYREDDPDNPVSMEPRATRWVNLDGLIHVGVEWGGSGGFWAHEVVHWPAGDPDPSVAVVADARPGANLRAPAGVLLLTASKLAEDDPTCCPSRREVVVLSRPDPGGGADATSTIVARDAETPAEIALTVYTAWVDRDLDRVSDKLTSRARGELEGAGPGEDIYAFAGRSCPVRGAVHVCTFETGGETLTFELGQVSGSGRYQVVDVSR